MNLTLRNEQGLQWTVAANGSFHVCGRTTDRLPPGAYACRLDNCGNPFFQPRDLRIDELIEFGDSLPARVLDEIERFWSMGQRFARLGFLHRRGYLFYGKQGCGKSSLIHQVLARLAAAGNVAFFCEFPPHFVACVQRFRQVEPDRPIVCVFEDVDAIIANYGDGDLLQWLDGNNQVDKAVNLASTNYPERLDRRIIARPRRFDRILRIDAPDDRVRSAFFSRKLPEQTREERARWVKLSEGLPFAGLAELVISVHCMGNGLEESAALLRALDCHQPSSKEFLEDFGAEAKAEAAE
jgi:SpoVK/Ycf46/Vps4 family AAA+-type ATPase